jgi:hypothetical protein
MNNFKTHLICFCLQILFIFPFADFLTTYSDEIIFSVYKD